MWKYLQKSKLWTSSSATLSSAFKERVNTGTCHPPLCSPTGLPVYLTAAHRLPAVCQTRSMEETGMSQVQSSHEKKQTNRGNTWPEIPTWCSKFYLDIWARLLLWEAGAVWTVFSHDVQTLWDLSLVVLPKPRSDWHWHTEIAGTENTWCD